MQKQSMEQSGSKPFIWTTRDGRKMELGEMGDEHLLNTQRMIRRRMVSYRESEQFYFHPIFGPTPGSMAEEAADQAMEEMQDERNAAYGVLDKLNEEIQRRGLQEKPVSGPRPLPKIKSVEHVQGGGTICQLGE